MDMNEEAVIVKIKIKQFGDGEGGRVGGEHAHASTFLAI